MPGDFSAAHRHDASDGEKRGALAGAVGSEQRDDFPRADFKRQVLEHFDGAISGADLVELQHGALRGDFLAEIGLDDLRVVAHFFRRAVGDLHAVVEDENFVGNGHDDFHVMFDEQDG